MVEKEKIIRELSIDLGQYIPYCSTCWHEIITWYGYSCVGLFPEKPSSFSWEDLYSDLLGTRIAGQALKENANFDYSVTRILNNELERLDAQPVQIARNATKKIYGKWFSGAGYPFISMNKRNFDIGLDDGKLTPWLVPGICLNNIPNSCEVLDLRSISRKGFSFDLELEPKCGSGKKAAKIVNKTRLQPELDFPRIVEHIKAQEIQKKGLSVCKPTLY